MDGSEVMALAVGVTALAAILSAIFAGVAARVAARNMTHEIFFRLQMEYRSPRMMHAVATLRDFHRAHTPRELVSEYMRIHGEDIERIAKLPETARVDGHSCTLHSHRRLVSQFYQVTARLYVNGIIPGKLVYSAWARADLEIIPQIIIPVENRLLHDLNDPPRPPLGRDHPLWRLYDDSKDFE